MGLRGAASDCGLCADSYPSSTSHPFFILWILSAVVSSCFTYTWDIKMDWGLFDPNQGDNRFLREEIVYSSPVSPPHSPTPGTSGQV